MTKKGFIVGFIVGCIFSFAVLTLGSLVLVRVYRPDGTKEFAPPRLPIAEADYDWQLTTIEGDDLDFADLRGRTIFMTIWKPSCSACQAELPVLERLYEEIEKDEAIAFIVVATYNDESILDLIGDYELTFPIYTYKGERPGAYKTPTVPTSFVISPAGKMVYTHNGGAKWDDPGFVAYLRSLSATPD